MTKTCISCEYCQVELRDMRYHVQCALSKHAISPNQHACNLYKRDWHPDSLQGRVRRLIDERLKVAVNNQRGEN